MSADASGKGRPVTQMSVAQMRVAMRNMVGELEEEKRRGITVEQIGPGKLDEAFRKATQP